MDRNHWNSPEFGCPTGVWCTVSFMVSLPQEVGQWIILERPMTFLNCPYGRVGVCVCAQGGSHCLPPPRDKKIPPWVCQKPLTNQTSHLASSLLPFILLLLPTFGHCYLASCWGIKKSASSGQRGSYGDTYQSAMSIHHKGPFLPITALLPSENGKTSSKVCLDPNICVVLTVRTSRKPRRERKALPVFLPDKDRKICCAVRVIGGSGQKQGTV